MNIVLVIKDHIKEFITVTYFIYALIVAIISYNEYTKKCPSPDKEQRKKCQKDFLTNPEFVGPVATSLILPVIGVAVGYWWFHRGEDGNGAEIDYSPLKGT